MVQRQQLPGCRFMWRAGLPSLSHGEVAHYPPGWIHIRFRGRQPTFTSARHTWRSLTVVVVSWCVRLTALLPQPTRPRSCGRETTLSPPPFFCTRACVVVWYKRKRRALVVMNPIAVPLGASPWRRSAVEFLLLLLPTRFWDSFVGVVHSPVESVDLRVVN